MRYLNGLALIFLLLATQAAADGDYCGRPVSKGSWPRAVDALHVLRSAIGTVQCPTETCDVNADCKVSVSDALETLSASVAGGGELRCGQRCSAEIPCGLSEAPTCGGECPAEHACRSAVVRGIPVCHVPPGNPGAAHTIIVGLRAVPAHLIHGDSLGRCPADRDDDSDSDRGLQGDLPAGGDAEMTMAAEPEAFFTRGWRRRWHRRKFSALGCRCTPVDTTTTTLDRPEPTTTTTTTLRMPEPTTTTTTLRMPEPTTTTTTVRQPEPTTTTTTLPAYADSDNDGLTDATDPCPFEPRNLCYGPVALDAETDAPLRINANASLDVECAGTRIDCNGEVWSADRGFTFPSANETCNFPDDCPIAGIDAIFGCSSAETEDLFQCGRFVNAGDGAALTYRFPVANGRYLVNLLFANTFTATAVPGDRAFDIGVEDMVLYAMFDQVVEAPGSQVALVRAAVVEVADGFLDVVLAPQVENPALKAIEVLAEGM